jgi:hypothetical protein
MHAGANIACFRIGPRAIFAYNQPMVPSERKEAVMFALKPTKAVLGTAIYVVKE